MKGNYAELLPLLEEDHFGYFVLIELNWNQNHFYTDLGRDITWNGQLYSSDCPVIALDTVRYSNIVDREAYRLSLSGLDPFINAELEAGIVHKAVKIRMVMVVDDQPMLGPRETIMIYDGLVSSTDHKINLDEKINTIECTAPLSDLDATGTMFTTRDGMKPYDPTDTSFDKIFEGSGTSNIKWGKQ